MIDCKWEQYLQTADHLQPFLSQVVPASSSSSKEFQNKKSQHALFEQISLAIPASRLKLVTALIDSNIRKILGLAETSVVPEDQPLTEQGFDSLMAVQLTNAVGRILGQRLPVSLVFNHPTPKALSVYLVELINTQLATESIEAETSSTAASSVNSSEQARSLLDDLDKLLEQT